MTDRPSTKPALRPAETLGASIGRTLRLALPVTLARTGMLTLVVVDVAMTGHAGAVELAYYGLAMALQVVMLLVGIGLLMGTVVMTAQAVGAGRPEECGGVWRVSLVHAAAYGAFALALSHGAEWFLVLVGQSPDLARGAGRVLVTLSWGMPALYLFITTSFFLEGINRPAPGVVVMLLANLANGALNWLFMYSGGEFSVMGAEGAALSTMIVRWLMFAALAVYVLARIDSPRYGIRGPIVEARGVGRRLRRISYPMGLGHGLESVAFSTMTLFAGLVGPAHIGGYQIAMNLLALAFMCALGFAAAASVGVGNAVGRRDQPGIRMAGWVATGLAAPVLAIVGAVYYGVPDLLVAVYTDDPVVVALAVPSVMLAAFALVPDGVQGVVTGALRGAADVWPATLIYIGAFWLFMVPLGYYFGVRLEGGAPALMTAVVTGGFAAALALAVRFHVVSGRTVGRV